MAASEIATAWRAGLDGAYDHSTFQGQLLDGLAALCRDTPGRTLAALVGASEALSEMAAQVAAGQADALACPDLQGRHEGADADLQAGYRLGFRTTWDRARTAVLELEPDPPQAAATLRGVARACEQAGQRLIALAGGEDPG